MRTATSRLTVDRFEGLVPDAVFLPISIIEMPPFEFVHREPRRLHRLAQQLAVPTLPRGAPRIQWIGPCRKLIVTGHHLDRLARLQVIQSQIHRTAAVVTRAVRGVGNEIFQVTRRGIPKHFRDVPWAVGIMNQQPQTLLFQLLMGRHHRFCGRPLHKSTWLFVENRTREIIRGPVAYIELNGVCELGQVDQLTCAEFTLLYRR